MKIKYLGPGKAVRVHPYGLHHKDVVEDYPEGFALELLATSKKQRFEAVEEDDTEKPMTVTQLKVALKEAGVKFPGNAKRDDLIALMKANVKGPEHTGKDDGNDTDGGGE